ncbi:MAG TPA: T9SS type A sorting domain-containing protein [Flavobacterium sp.]|nr:T9SS type A sorting domain-containing protein [Flavobacterium sp.]
MKRKVLYLMMCLFAITFANAQVTSVAIVGADVGGWPTGAVGEVDTHQMSSTDGVHWTYTQLQIIPAATDSGLKFRANNAWTINWGSADFPTGVATLDGPNIHGVANFYDVTFNSDTGEFHFEGPSIPVVKLVGTAVSEAGGLTMSTSDAETYTLTNVTLLDGNAQFDIEGAVFGGPDFPSGTLVDETVSIPVVAGTYSSITVNTSTAEYFFTTAPVYPSIAIVGSGAGGWPVDPQVDANVLATTDGETYTGFVTLTAFDGSAGSGEIKFRSNNNWSDPNWGGTGFPDGPTADGNIVVNVSGYYGVTFTRSTGAYHFALPSVALVGGATPNGWPTGAVGEVDAAVMSTTDGVAYTLNSITLTADEFKLRQNNSWDVAWGAITFPSGIVDATPGSANIMAIAGTYGVTFNRTSGQLTFGDVLATTSFEASAFKAYPNPTNNNWNFTSANQSIEKIQIVDVLGKTVLSVNPQATTATVDASALNSGIYFARISTANATKTVKLVKN